MFVSNHYRQSISKSIFVGTNTAQESWRFVHTVENLYFASSPKSKFQTKQGKNILENTIDVFHPCIPLDTAEYSLNFLFFSMYVSISKTRGSIVETFHASFREAHIKLCKARIIHVTTVELEWLEL